LEDPATLLLAVTCLSCCHKKSQLVAVKIEKLMKHKKLVKIEKAKTGQDMMFLLLFFFSGCTSWGTPLVLWDIYVHLARRTVPAGVVMMPISGWK
jgi:hypothetical protein